MTKTTDIPAWKERLQEADGSFSSTRLLLVFWSLAVLILWIVASIVSLLKDGTIADIPTAVAGLLGALATGKVVQRFSENAAIKLADLNVDDPFKPVVRGTAKATDNPADGTERISPSR